MISVYNSETRETSFDFEFENALFKGFYRPITFERHAVEKSFKGKAPTETLLNIINGYSGNHVGYICRENTSKGNIIPGGSSPGVGTFYDLYLSSDVICLVYKTDGKNVVYVDPTYKHMNFEKFDLLQPTTYCADEGSIFLGSIPSYSTFVNGRVVNYYGCKPRGVIDCSQMVIKNSTPVAVYGYKDMDSSIFYVAKNAAAALRMLKIASSAGRMSKGIDNRYGIIFRDSTKQSSKEFVECIKSGFTVEPPTWCKIFPKPESESVNTSVTTQICVALGGKIPQYHSKSASGEEVMVDMPGTDVVWFFDGQVYNGEGIEKWLNALGSDVTTDACLYGNYFITTDSKIASLNKDVELFKQSLERLVDKQIASAIDGVVTNIKTSVYNGVLDFCAEASKVTNVSENEAAQSFNFTTGGFNGTQVNHAFGQFSFTETCYGEPTKPKISFNVAKKKIIEMLTGTKGDPKILGCPLYSTNQQTVTSVLDQYASLLTEEGKPLLGPDGKPLMVDGKVCYAPGLKNGAVTQLMAVPSNWLSTVREQVITSVASQFSKLARPKTADIILHLDDDYITWEDNCGKRYIDDCQLPSRNLRSRDLTPAHLMNMTDPDQVIAVRSNGVTKYTKFEETSNWLNQFGINSIFVSDLDPKAGSARVSVDFEFLPLRYAADHDFDLAKYKCKTVPTLAFTLLTGAIGSLKPASYFTDANGNELYYLREGSFAHPYDSCTAKWACDYNNTNRRHAIGADDLRYCLPSVMMRYTYTVSIPKLNDSFGEFAGEEGTFASMLTSVKGQATTAVINACNSYIVNVVSDYLQNNKDNALSSLVAIFKTISGDYLDAMSVALFTNYANTNSASIIKTFEGILKNELLNSNETQVIEAIKGLIKSLKAPAEKAEWVKEIFGATRPWSYTKVSGTNFGSVSVKNYNSYNALPLYCNIGG